MIGVPIVIFTWMQPELNFFKGLNLANIAATAIMVGLIVVIAWKYYHEKNGR